MTAWLLVTIDVPPGTAEASGEQLEALGAAAVTFMGPDAEDIFEPDPGAQPLWSTVRLEALFEIDADLALVRATVEDTGMRVVDANVIEDADWQNRWRVHAVRALIGGRLWVLPRDEPVPDDPEGGLDCPVLRLDPGLAFGSGAHPTTRLCLEWLASTPLAGRRVLDFGCGSGILALSARLLGARSVLAIDHDPQALAATLENASVNGVGAPDLAVGDAALLDDAAQAEPFDVSGANSLANPLIALAPELFARLAPGGALVLSGLLETQGEAVMAAYPGIEFEPVAQIEDWIRLSGRKTGGITDVGRLAGASIAAGHST
ncbi:MAG: 50S ribosomal protein L11 methyltransferase [Gammaproteobacteria bacterium]